MEKSKKKAKRKPISFGKQRSEVRNNGELALVKRIGEKVYRDLYQKSKPIEWLAFESETSRASVRRILDGEKNITILTLDRVVKALGYLDVFEFFKKN